MYLCASARIRPDHLHATMRNHQTSFLGAAQYEVDMHPPTARGDIYLKPTVAGDPAQYFSAILFGAVSSLPTETYGATSFEVSCPDWSASGWSKSSFTAIFKEQFRPLHTAVMADMDADYEINRFPKVQEWTSADRIVVDIWNRHRFQFASYEYPDLAASGSYFECFAKRDGSNFPFALGETVVIGANLSRVCVEYGDNDRTREYHILGKHIKAVRPAQASLSAFEIEKQCGEVVDDESDTETLVEEE
ncbi:hypothetical protein C8F04DRAFT_1181604 [Mycena alexandri]|uniref:Uncharacterized protein n=1 Tax=Mycena alexandri TaxID=1745969 RepID=A0AAD6SYD3_9AGAR|nr:hypothetical protein C8F04DRAFT_1181604 [Mycena alexandri]